MAELLAPAGSLESLRAAVHAGADAVYIGGSRFGARAYADNPDETDLIRGIEYCHIHGRKLYLTVNTLMKEQELYGELERYLLPYYRSGVDGLIVQDLGAVRFLRERFPGLELHASTQMSVTSPEGALLLKRHGICRIVPARELSLPEIRAIIEETGLEAETFIHGAMCYSYSGRCLFSSLLGGRSGNRGRCAQPCRLPYTLEDSGEKTGTGHRADTAKGQGNCLLSMKDMCALDLLPELVDAGIASFKIEGRMKRSEYTAGVVSVYRKYLDLYQEKGRKGYRVDGKDKRVLLDLYNRGGFSEGYYHTQNGPSMMAMTRPNHQGTLAARIRAVRGRQVTAAAVEPLHPGDVLELPDGREVTLTDSVPEGGSFSVSLPKSGREQAAAAGFGREIYRTRNEALYRELRERYLDREFKVKINGEFRIFPDRPAILKVWVQEGDRQIAASASAMLASPAKTSPARAEEMEQRLRKTGATPFVFDRLTVSLPDGLFVPVKALNELRREALDRLFQELLDRRGRRPDPALLPAPDREIRRGQTAAGAEEMHLSAACTEEMNSGTAGAAEIHSAKAGAEKVHSNAALPEGLSSDAEPGRKLRVLVTLPDQLKALADSALLHALDTVYLDAQLFDFTEEDRGEAWLPGVIENLKACGISCFFAAPPVLRTRERALLMSRPVRGLLRQMDGFLVSSVDLLAYFQAFAEAESMRSVQFAADESLYSFNSEAKALLAREGVCRFTLPAELNFRELSCLDLRDAELVVYGYQPVMQSAQCLLKNTAGCAGKTEPFFLRDRKGARFPVLNRCRICCNTIYNSVPLQLGVCWQEVLRLSPAGVRLSFTVESYGETERILGQYEKLLRGTDGMELSDGRNTTRGHFKRGVE